MRCFISFVHFVGAAFAGGALLAGGVGRVSAAPDAPKPTIFICGDSTARNSAPGRNGQPCVGWGTPFAAYFDPARVTIANLAHAGQSSRTYYHRPGDWPSVLPRIRAGDYLLLVFGLNDGGPPRTEKDRGSVPGLGDETIELPHADGTTELVHTYGWYMRAMATAAREQGAQVFFFTVTTRNIWSNPRVKFNDATPVDPLPADYEPTADRIERGTGHGQFTQWTKELGAELHLPVLDLTNLCADRYEAMGREKVNVLFSDHNHTYAAGADFVAVAIVSGLKAFPASPFGPLLSAAGRAVAPAEAKYVNEPRPR